MTEKPIMRPPWMVNHREKDEDGGRASGAKMGHARSVGVGVRGGRGSFDAEGMQVPASRLARRAREEAQLIHQISEVEIRRRETGDYPVPMVGKTIAFQLESPLSIPSSVPREHGIIGWLGSRAVVLSRLLLGARPSLDTSQAAPGGPRRS